MIEGDAAATLRYRNAIGAEQVRILADVLVKHATPLAPLSPEQAARDTVARGCADGVIVTGSATGSAIDPIQLRDIRDAVPTTPLYLGSGVTPDNVETLASNADGAIVGSWLKRDGDIAAPIDVERVRVLSRSLASALRAAG